MLNVTECHLLKLQLLLLPIEHPPPRSSKHQSPTTVFFRTTLTWTITLYKLLNYWSKKLPNLPNLIKYDEKRYLGQFILILCSRILIDVFHNISITVCCYGNILGSRPPQYKALLATLGIPFWYLPMVPHPHDPSCI